MLGGGLMMASSKNNYSVTLGTVSGNPGFVASGGWTSYYFGYSATGSVEKNQPLFPVDYSLDSAIAYNSGVDLDVVIKDELNQGKPYTNSFTLSVDGGTQTITLDFDDTFSEGGIDYHYYTDNNSGGSFNIDTTYDFKITGST